MEQRPPAALPQTRPYQDEMLQESLKRNIVIAMDTGSGKSHIAILRMQHQLDRDPGKVAWFLAPNVGLCEQQRAVISACLPVPVGLISGALEPNQWTNKSIWTKALETHRIIVSTPQVLLDALRHGYISMTGNLSLLVFDEAHHAADKHPYNMIMREFYDKCPSSSDGSVTSCRPSIMGLTASPMFGGDVKRAFEKIERNLDSVIFTPQAQRHDLEKHVHRPQFSFVQYPDLEVISWTRSANTVALDGVYKTLRIENDPYVKALRHQLTQKLDEPKRKRTDQRLSQAIDKKDTFVHKGMRDFLRTAKELCIDIGPWAADWYVYSVVTRALKGDSEVIREFFRERHQNEKVYLIDCLKRINPSPPAKDTESIVGGCSKKTETFIKCLLDEKAKWEAKGEEFYALTFITRRDGALALSVLLSLHPRTAAVFSVGTLVGGSESTQRNAFLDITRALLSENQTEVLSAFRVGDRNLVISTAVAEEGIDIQACCSVIRWDPPQNMVSWAQSRGRARKKSSSFILMFEENGCHMDNVRKWENMERQMKESYNNEERLRKIMLRQLAEADRDDDDGEAEEYVIKATGAKVTSHSAVSHIAHFCNKLYGRERDDIMPLYDFSPPDYPNGFHSQPNELRVAENTGPFGATLTLPRLLPHELRIFKTEEIHPSKKAAQRKVAFEAYKAMYQAGLLNEHLLPLGTDLQRLQDEEVQRAYAEVEAREGTANVAKELDPWMSMDVADAASSSGAWWSNMIQVDGLGRLQMFTRKQLTQMDFSSDLLHDPTFGPRQFSVTPGNVTNLSEDQILDARIFTRRLFSVLHGSRMDSEALNFAYLFLPEEADAHEELIWAERRDWAASLNSAESETAHNEVRMNARLFGEQYNHPSDIIMVESSKLFAFKDWKFERLRPQEEESVRRRYAWRQNFKITYPLIIAEPIRQRRNFLLSSSEPEKERSTVILLPQFTRVILEGEKNLTFGILLPSIIRAMFVKLIAQSFKDSVLHNVLSLRRIRLDLVQTALVTPGANSLQNYERLESLGDAVLKFTASIHLLAAHPHWPEGFLTMRKDHSVANSHLAKAAIEKRIFKWIVRRNFVPRKWSPDYVEEMTDDSEAPAEQQISISDTVSTTDQDGATVINGDNGAGPENLPDRLSTKTLADVVESVTGAAYVTDGFDCAIECLDALNIDIGTPWGRLSDCVSSILAKVEPMEEELIVVNHVQQMLGYDFKHKALVTEALMHSSSISSVQSLSYERMEFLGDALIDVIVIDTLYRAEKDGLLFAPKDIHLRKAAVVNTHFLAFLCLRANVIKESELNRWDWTLRQSVPFKERHSISLSQCLIHSNSKMMDESRDTLTRFKRDCAEIEKKLETDAIFPWAALARLQAPKFMSDMVESLIGAIYLDSEGSMVVVKTVLDKLGFMKTLKRIISKDVQLLHPVSRVMEWASKHQMTDEVKLEVTKEHHDKRITCKLIVDGEVLISEVRSKGGRASEEDVKFQVAEKGILLLEERFGP